MFYDPDLSSITDTADDKLLAMDWVLVGLILVTTSTCTRTWNVTAKHNPAYQSVSSQSSDGHLLTIPAAEQSNSLARS